MPDEYRQEPHDPSFFGRLSSAVGSMFSKIGGYLDTGLTATQRFADKLNDRLGPINDAIGNIATAVEAGALAAYAAHPSSKAAKIVETAGAVRTGSNMYRTMADDVNSAIQDPDANFARQVEEGRKMYEEDQSRIREKAAAQERARQAASKKKKRKKGGSTRSSSQRDYLARRGGSKQDVYRRAQ